MAEVILVLLLPVLTAGCLDPCNNCVTVSTSGPGTFSKTGPLHEERAFASSAVLPNGTSALVAGGGRVSGYLTRAQLFDASSSPAMFAPDAELNDARANHTATLLHDSHVLITGGDNGLEALNSCEIYVPGSGHIGSFVNAASMFATRTHHSATLLKDGRVFIAGGSPAVRMVNIVNSMGQVIRTDVIPSGALNTAEFFVPTTGNFVGVFDSLTSARTEHTATLLDDGTVLLVGGVDQNGTALASAEIFDPHTQTFAPTAGTLHFSRFDHTATLIHCKSCAFDGKVLIAGGFDNASQTDASTQKAELYDPSTKTFAVEAAMTIGRALHTATELDDGSVLIAGGINNDPALGFLNLMSAETFSLTTGSFVATANNMSAERSGAASAVVNVGGMSEVLITFGGEVDFNGSFLLSLPSSDLYDPGSMMFSAGPASPPSCSVNPNLNPFGCALTRIAHTATTLSDGRLLIAGGYEATPVRLNSTEIYDLSAGQFSPGPDMNETRVFQTSSVILGPTHTGDVLVAGGDPPCDGSAERYDVTANKFIPTGPMTTQSRCTYFTATPLNDGRVLFTGGLDGNLNVQNTAELYNPSTDTFTATGNLNSPRWGHVAVQLTDGSNDVLIVGGANCTATGCFLNTAELFDPSTGMFTPTTTPANKSRFFGSANNLPNPGIVAKPNGVLIAGGSGDNTAELYDPATQTFSFTSNMNFIRFFQTATTLFPDTSGLVLLTGGSGRNAFDNLIPLSSAEIFDATAGTFCRTGDMTTGRAFHSATALGTGKDLRVLIAGGFGDNSSLGTAELYTPNMAGCSASSKAAQFKSIAGASERVRAAMSTYLNAMSHVGIER